MRRASFLHGVLVMAVIAALTFTQRSTAHAISIGYRGGAEDHYWNVDVTFCKDGFMVSAVEIAHQDGGTGDDKPFSLVLSRTTTLITSPLPFRIGGGVGGPNRQLATATAYFTYTQAQAPGAPIQIIIERWEHGDDNADDDTGDFSVGDDREILNDAAANCTLVTPPTFDVPPSPRQGRTFTVGPRAPLSFVVEASDADGLDTVTLSASDLPSGASFPPSAPANPASSTFSWTPTAAQTGRHVVHFSAVDSTGRTTPAYSVTIDVLSRAYLPLVLRPPANSGSAGVGADDGGRRRAPRNTGAP